MAPTNARGVHAITDPTAPTADDTYAKVLKPFLTVDILKPLLDFLGT